METTAPSASYMDLTQEAATAPQQPPSRFRPSNYTVDLSNTTNPPPPQVMVKPAVMMRRDERPPPTSPTGQLRGHVHCRWSTPDTLYPVGRAGAHHLRNGRGRDGVLLRIHLGSRRISKWPPWHLIRRLSETQRPRSQDRGDGAGAGHGGLWDPRSMVEL